MQEWNEIAFYHAKSKDNGVDVNVVVVGICKIKDRSPGYSVLMQLMEHFLLDFWFMFLQISCKKHNLRH